MALRYISNGTCYYQPFEEAHPAYIPCGNDAFGHKTCCQAGDMCLSSRACYNAEYETTYLAGCSDPDWRDASCPDKKGLDDSQWVGLVTCPGSNLWAACWQSNSPDTLTSPDPCSCSGSAILAFTDAPTLTNIVLLPIRSGGLVVWQQGFLPTSPTSTSTSTSSSSLMTYGSSTPSPTSKQTTSAVSPSALPQNDGVGGWDTSTKAGIAVGVTLAGLLILAAIAFFLWQWRRHREPEPQIQQDLGHEPKHDSFCGADPSTPATFTISELEPRAARPWSLRSELPENGGSPRSLGTVLEDIRTRDGDWNNHGAVTDQGSGLRPLHELQG